MNSQQYDPVQGQPASAPNAQTSPGNQPGQFEHAVQQSVVPPPYGQQSWAAQPQQALFVDALGYQPPVFVQGYYNKNPRRTQATKRLNGTSMICLSQTALSFLLQILFVFVFVAIDSSIYYMGLPDPMYNWMSAVMVPLATLLPAVIYMVKNRMDPVDSIRFEHRNAWFTILGILGGFGVCLLGNFPAGIIDTFLKNIGLPSVDTGPQGYDPASSWVYMLAVAVLAPVIEEFVFRGIILTRLEKYGKWFAVVGSAIIFGIAHGDIARFAFAFIAGLVFGFLYVKTRNIWVPVIVHFLNNSLAVVQQYASYFLSETESETLNELTLYIPIILGMVCILILLLVWRRKFFTLRTPQEVSQDPLGHSRGTGLTAGESAGALVRSAGLWVIFAGMLIMTLYTRMM